MDQVKLLENYRAANKRAMELGAVIDELYKERDIAHQNLLTDTSRSAEELTKAYAIACERVEKFNTGEFRKVNAELRRLEKELCAYPH